MSDQAQKNKLHATQRVLITGGAGFIGGHLADLLLKEGYEVAIYDALIEQVHGLASHDDGWIPAWTMAQEAKGAVFYKADITNPDSMKAALENFRPHTVVHLAAEVGVGQGEHEISRYLRTNVLGTGVLIEQILASNDSLSEEDQLDGVRRLVTAGSMSSYGEGFYVCQEHGSVRSVRSPERVLDGDFDPECPYVNAKEPCGSSNHIKVAQTPEWASLRPGGVYAQTKRDTEELVMGARRMGLSCATLRLFNVIGPRQSLRNPYTGVCAIFAARCLSGLPPRVYEDGQQMRDFVHVMDVAEAFRGMIGPKQLRLAMRYWNDPSYQDTFNVASGKGTTIEAIANIACQVLAPEMTPEITGQVRVGDVRHCIGSASKLTNVTGWALKVGADVGLRFVFEEFRREAEEMDLDPQALERAHSELEDRRLVLATGPQEDAPNPAGAGTDLEAGESGWGQTPG